MLYPTILSLVLVSLWVAAWLHWCFDGEIRHFLFAYVFPEAWRAGREKSDVLTLPKDQFEIFLGAESMAPAFVRGVLGCPGCLSTYISMVGTVFACFSLLLPAAGTWVSLLCLPLIWAGAAWIGHRLHQYL